MDDRLRRPSGIVIDRSLASGPALRLDWRKHGKRVIPVELAWVDRCVCVFRLYDIVKPGPVGWADRKDNLQRA
jgi:phosphatidylglycerophosphatase A